jgi:hypothetical protein
MPMYSVTKYNVGNRNIVTGMFSGFSGGAAGEWNQDYSVLRGLVTGYPVIQMYMRITTDGINPATPILNSKVTPQAYRDQPRCTSPTANWFNEADTMETINENKGSDGDTWGVNLTPDIVNSPGFGIILYPPNSGLSNSNFGFNIPTYATITGVSVNISWRHTCVGENDWHIPNQTKHETYYIDGFGVTVYYAIECTSGSQQCSDGHLYSCINSRWVDYGANTSCPGTECVGEQTKRCIGKDSYVCVNGYLFLSRANDTNCPGDECDFDSCVDGYHYTCNNGWKSSGIRSDCCAPTSTKCVEGKKYVCNIDQNWINNGLDNTCPGTDCISGQTECIGGNRFDCNNGYWVDQGADQICPGTGCTGDVTHCIEDHRFTCENGYDVDQGVDVTCPGLECAGTATHCDGEHLIACENGWYVDKGINVDCQDTPIVDNTMLYVAAGVVATAGILLLLLGGKSNGRDKK